MSTVTVISRKRTSSVVLEPTSRTTSVEVERRSSASPAQLPPGQEGQLLGYGPGGVPVAVDPPAVTGVRLSSENW